MAALTPGTLADGSVIAPSDVIAAESLAVTTSSVASLSWATVMGRAKASKLHSTSVRVMSRNSLSMVILLRGNGELLRQCTSQKCRGGLLNPPLRMLQGV